MSKICLTSLCDKSRQKQDTAQIEYETNLIIIFLDDGLKYINVNYLTDEIVQIIQTLLY